MNVCDNLGDHLVGNVYVKVNIMIYTIVVVIHTFCFDV